MTAIDVLHPPTTGLADQSQPWTEVRCKDLVARQSPVILDADMPVEAAAEVPFQFPMIHFISPRFNALTDILLGLSLQAQ